MEMNKVRVTITYTTGKIGHGRYGCSQRVENVVRFCDEAELDKLISQFRTAHEIIEVKIARV